MKKIPFALLALAGLTTLAGLAGCATAPQIPIALAPRTLVLERFFKGDMVADGVFTNTLSGATRKVHVLLHGSWNGRTLDLFENFFFADGERQKKTWHLTKTSPTTYTGTREDVVGSATGTQVGAQVRLMYDANIVSNGSSIQVTFSDVLALQKDGSVLNRAVISKFGVQIGTVKLIIRHR